MSQAAVKYAEKTILACLASVRPSSNPSAKKQTKNFLSHKGTDNPNK
jgi:hypothetical protein